VTVLSLELELVRELLADGLQTGCMAVPPGANMCPYRKD